MREKIEKLQNTPIVWGEMEANYAEWAAGTDVTLLFAGLPDDKCPCPHWGYVFYGSLHIRYSDDSEEIIKAGEAFYNPPGHTAWVEEDTAFLIFSPHEEHAKVMEHVQKKLKELS